MAKDGWIAVRNVPLPVTSHLKSGTALYKVFQDFFRHHRICPKCEGYGFLVKKELETKDVLVLKYEGIRPLETLKDYKDLAFGDVVREILLKHFAGRKVCPRCSGERFIAKELKAE